MEKVRNRRGKRKSPVDTQKEPKQKINRRSKKKLNEIFDSQNISTDNTIEPVSSTNTKDENTTSQPILNTEQVFPPLQQSVQSNYNLFYTLLILSVLLVIIVAYFIPLNH